VIAFVLAAAFSTLIAFAPWFDRAITPWIVAGQAFPKEALTPLLAVWLGYSMLPKTLLSASICFFPITIALSRGLLSTDMDTVDMLRVLGASRSQQFFMYRLPNSLTSLLTGLRIAFPMSLIGAVVGELWGSSAGLGYLIRVNRAHLDPAFVFGSLVLLAFLGLLDFIVVVVLEWVFRKYLDRTSPIGR
jgi:NitT/TauT family transport system permease protein